MGAGKIRPWEGKGTQVPSAQRQGLVSCNPVTPSHRHSKTLSQKVYPSQQTLFLIFENTCCGKANTSSTAGGHICKEQFPGSPYPDTRSEIKFVKGSALQIGLKFVSSLLSPIVPSSAGRTKCRMPRLVFRAPWLHAENRGSKAHF